MQGSIEIESKLREIILGLEDDDVSADLEALLEALNQRDRKISETLDELLNEVDKLILLADHLEEDNQCNR